MISPTVYANSAEPSSLVVIVNFPPDDLVLTLRLEDGNEIELPKIQTAWEAQYSFSRGMIVRPAASLENATLIAAWDDTAFEYTLPESMLSHYNNILTLDIRSQTFANGQTFARSAILLKDSS